MKNVGEICVKWDTRRTGYRMATAPYGISLTNFCLVSFVWFFFFFRQSSCPFLASLLLTVAEYKGYF